MLTCVEPCLVQLLAVCAFAVRSLVRSLWWIFACFSDAMSGLLVCGSAMGLPDKISTDKLWVADSTIYLGYVNGRSAPQVYQENLQDCPCV